MQVTYEGTVYEFDMDEVTVKQAIKIEKHMGCTLDEWGKQLEKGGSMLALQALGWLILFGGKTIPVEDADFKIVRLGESFAAAMAAEQEKEAAAGAARPTLPPMPPNGSGDGSTPVLSLPSSPTA